MIYLEYPFENCVVRYSNHTGTLVWVKFKGEKERQQDMKTSNLAAEAVSQGKPISKAQYENY